MALAKLADRVLVMKNGKIVQDGTHKQLSLGLNLCCKRTQLEKDLAAQ